MAENSKIEWTDHTFNPWIGCTKVGLPCDNCYAEDMMDRRYGRVVWGNDGERVRTAPGTWAQMRKWNKAAALAGTRPFVFSLSLGDIWDNRVDPAWRRDAFDLARECPNLVMLYLSKRIGNAVEMARDAGGLPPNAALGSTFGNQPDYDRDRRDLLALCAGLFHRSRPLQFQREPGRMTFAARPDICTAALWSCCRCSRCRSLPPASGAFTAAPDAAAARSSGPFPSGGGTPSPSIGALAVAPLDPPVAARRPLRECRPGGDLFGDAE